MGRKSVAVSASSPLSGANRQGDPEGVLPRPVSGRRAVLLSIAIIGGLFLLSLAYAFTGAWRQKERLLADGLAAPRAALWMEDEGVVVIDAGEPGRPGDIVWVSTGSSRQRLVPLPPTDPDDPIGGAVGLALAGDGSLILAVSRCAAPGCMALLGPDRSGSLAPLVDLRAGGAADPSAVIVDRGRGIAFVADAGADRLWSVAIGTGRPIAGAMAVHSSFPAGAEPRGMAFDPGGALLVALAGRGEIARVEPTGASTSIVARDLRRPIAVGVEPTGTFVILESPRAQNAGVLKRLDEAGQTTILSDGLDRPTSLSVAPDGRVFVTLRGIEADVARVGQLVQIRRLGPSAPRRIV